MTPVPVEVPGLLKSRLGRRLLGLLVIVLTVCSLLFLAVFVTAYRSRLIGEHARASMQINKLLEASLKNAMLKRDIPGLRAIIGELAQHPDIDTVFILNPAGEIRFSTRPELEGKPFDGSVDGDQATSRFTIVEQSREVLRTVNPVHNEDRCKECHGARAAHPVNGILVVDYAAGSVRGDSWRGAILMASSGFAVLFAALAAVALLLQRRVLRPLGQLANAAGQFAEGKLEERIGFPGDDEVAQLGQRFNAMAGKIDTMIRAVRSNEDFLQRVIDAMPDGVRVIGRDYRIIKVNAAYCRQLGIAPAEALGKPCHLSSHGSASPCSPRLVTCPLEELKAGKPSLKCRHRHLRRDGGELFVEVSAALAVVEQDGKDTECVIESIRDMAEQTEASHQHRLSEIGQIAAGIAHEIHNPLSSIHLALSAIKTDTEKGDGAGLSQYLDIASREIDRCLDVTGRLLRISEPGSGDKALLGLEEIVTGVVALVRYQAEQANVVVRLDAAGHPRVFANESDLGIVVLNLVQNAVHAMPRGGTLTVAMAAVAGKVRVTFADTGVGIPQDDLKRIFWPFWSRRADGSMGSGLGLSIVRAALERMGGTIAVESEVGKGTTFTIELPNPDHEETGS